MVTHSICFWWQQRWLFVVVQVHEPVIQRGSQCMPRCTYVLHVYVRVSGNAATEPFDQNFNFLLLIQWPHMHRFYVNSGSGLNILSSHNRTLEHINSDLIFKRSTENWYLGVTVKHCLHIKLINICCMRRFEKLCKIILCKLPSKVLNKIDSVFFYMYSMQNFCNLP